MLESFRNNKLASIYVSVLFWHVGGAFVFPFTSLWLRNDIGEASFIYLGLLLSIPSIVGIIGISTISNFTDNKGHYVEMIFFINLIGTLQYLLLTQISKSYQYIIIVGIAALVFPAYYTIIQAFATNICEINERGRVTGHLMLFASLGWFLGSLGSGISYRVIGIKLMFVISAISIFLSGLIIYFGPNKKRVDGELLISTTKVETTSLWKLFKDKQIFYLTLTIILLDFSAGAFFLFASVFLFEEINMSSDMIGYANALATFFGTLILIKLGSVSDRIGRRPIYLLGLIIYPIFFIGISFFHQVLIVFAFWSFPIYALLRPTAPAMMADLTSEKERSRGMGIITIASTLSMALGAIFGGFMADNTNLGMNVWTIFPAIFSWISVIIGFILVRETLPLKNKFSGNISEK